MSYLIPTQSLMDEQIIKKSRFITHIGRAEHKKSATDFIQQIKHRYPDARHHCWAYIAGHPTETIERAFNDDGEPQGTAGKPMLNVLQHRHIGEIVLVVVRYFGGIKLGAGGLVRAYSSSASRAIDKLAVETLVATKIFQISFAYALENNIKYLLETYHSTIQQADYSEDVCLHIAVPEEIIELLNAQLTNITAGKVSLI